MVCCRSPLWNLTLIAETSVDYIMTMQTYTGECASFLHALATVSAFHSCGLFPDDFTVFSQNAQAAVQIVPPSKLVIGLETVQASNNQPYTTAQLQERFDLLDKLGVVGIGIWDSPIPDNWFPFLKAWAGNS
jgi:hypothetical protein